MKTCPLCETAYPNQHTSCPTDGALLIERRELEPGTVIRGKYRIERKLGQGGMGTVYLAEHMLLSRQRALKFISSELSQDPAFLRRFRREAQAASELRHPNLVEVVDLDQAEDGTPYIAMEFVDGSDLRHALKTGTFSVDRTIAIARGIAQGLGAAHKNGIVHRDIKPENILLAGGDGKPEMPKLLDFGIAAIKEGSTALSHTHGLMLTPPYAAPEQWKGMPAEELDGRVDLYALGCVFYEMLTGQTPFHAHNTEGWMYQHLYQDPQPPSRLRPALLNYPGLDEVLLCLLAREREQRFPSTDAFLAALDNPSSLVSRITVQAAPQLPEFPAQVRAQTAFAPPAPAPSIPDSAPEAGLPKSSRLLRWAIVPVALLAAAGIYIAIGGFRSKPLAAPPVLSPTGGTYASTQIVTLSDPTPGAVLHYTVDGSQPTEASPVYTQPLASLPSGTQVRAFAAGNGFQPSAEVSGLYLWFGTSRPSTPGASSASNLGAPPGSAYEQAKTAYDRKQYQQARTLFSQACDSGEMKACNYLGYLYAQGLGGAKNAQRANAVYSGACDQGNLSSCASLGSLYQNSGKVQEARAYFKKACDGGLKEACSLLSGAQ